MKVKDLRLTDEMALTSDLSDKADLADVLTLNQTTPQTFVNGIPLLTDLTPTTDYEISHKKYVDDITFNKVARVVHGAVSTVERPTVEYVEWVGTVTPDNAIANDTWVDIS